MQAIHNVPGTKKLDQVLKSNPVLWATLAIRCLGIKKLDQVLESNPALWATLAAMCPGIKKLDQVLKSNPVLRKCSNDCFSHLYQNKNQPVPL